MIRLFARIYTQTNYQTNYLSLLKFVQDGLSVYSINRANLSSPSFWSVANCLWGELPDFRNVQDSFREENFANGENRQNYCKPSSSSWQCAGYCSCYTLDLNGVYSYEVRSIYCRQNRRCAGRNVHDDEKRRSCPKNIHLTFTIHQAS